MGKTLVIGIAGGSASGKSTFCETLTARLDGLKVKEIHMDSYFKPKNERPISQSPVLERTFMDDNHPDTVDLKSLYADLLDDIQSGQFEVIVVEGLLTLHDRDICSKLDLKLFVDCRADERIVRRIRRNMKTGLTYDEIADVYLGLVRYRHDQYVEPSKWKADFIINGSQPSEKALQIVTSFIRNSTECN